MERLYAAYGSNLNVEQMLERCPGARVEGRSWIEDYQLLFKGSKTGAYLTIEPKAGKKVPVAIWNVTEDDERMLDRYEGYPRFYYKKTFYLKVGGVVREVFAYIMHEERQPGLPCRWYVDVCREGYNDFGFDERYLAGAVGRARRACAFETA